MKLLKLALLLLIIPVLSSAQSIPAVKAKALDNSEITLPIPGSQQVLILMVGFSHKSGDLCKVWGKRISADYHADARIAYFTMPVLQSAPSLVRPMIVHGMRKDVPAQELAHFIPIYSSESDWKKVVNFSAPDDAYLIVAMPDGHAVWQAHGPFSDSTYADLKKSVAILVEKGRHSLRQKLILTLHFVPSDSAPSHNTQRPWQIIPVPTKWRSKGWMWLAPEIL